MAEYKTPKEIKMKLKRLKKSKNPETGDVAPPTGYETSGDPDFSGAGEIDLERDTQAVPHEDYLRAMKKTLRRKKKKSSTSPREIQEEKTNEAGRAVIESERLKNEKKIKRILEGL